MMFTIIPDYVDAEITAKLDAAIAECPDAEADRDFLRSQLVDAFHKYGVVPPFTLTPNLPEFRVVQAE